MLQEFMYYDHVEPVPFADAITAFIKRWKENDVYVVADTSTLPGCELSTVRFLHQTYRGCFDGILLPRNHDGNGTVTKISALEAAKAAMVSQREFSTFIPTYLIEDTSHHAIAFAEHPASTKVIMPEYGWNEACSNHEYIDRVVQSLGTVDAFIHTDNELSAAGIISKK